MWKLIAFLSLGKSDTESRKQIYGKNKTKHLEVKLIMNWKGIAHGQRQDINTPWCD